MSRLTRRSQDHYMGSTGPPCCWILSNSSTGMWQFIMWLGELGPVLAGGGELSQIAPIFRGQRPAKKQPLKASRRLGTAPSRRICVCSASGFGMGAAERSASVYGWDGAFSTHADGPVSATCPAYSTRMSSETYLTTPRSCEMNMYDVPSYS